MQFAMKSLIPREELLKVLSDGQWHPLSDFLAIARKYVTPERACRHYISNSGYAATRERYKKEPLDLQVTRGRYAFLTNTLRQLTYKSLIERRGKGFTQEYHILQGQDNA